MSMRGEFIDLYKETISPRVSHFTDILFSNHNKPKISDDTQKSMTVYVGGHIIRCRSNSVMKALSTKFLALT